MKTKWIVITCASSLIVGLAIGSVYINHRHFFRPVLKSMPIMIPNATIMKKGSITKEETPKAVVTVSDTGFTFSVGNWLVDAIVGLIGSILLYFCKKYIDWFFKKKELKLYSLLDRRELTSD